jgi:hypothetical protein
MQGSNWLARWLMGKQVAGQAFSDTPPDGRFIVVVYEEIDDDTVLPVTAYEVPEP